MIAGCSLAESCSKPAAPTPRAPPSPGPELVGRWVMIAYDDQESPGGSSRAKAAWYTGLVMKFDASKHRHKLQWEDGSTDWVDGLKHDEYRLTTAPKPKMLDSQSPKKRQRKSAKGSKGPKKSAQQVRINDTPSLFQCACA